MIIDRFEENFAVCEMPSGEMVNVPKILFPDAKEGDKVIITVLKNNERKEKIDSLMNKLFED